MKTVLIVLITLFAAVLVNAPSGMSETKFPEYAGRTCSGDEAGPLTQVYYFGFEGPNDSCATRAFHANTYGEARECAIKSCEVCSRVEDITDWYRYGSAVPQGNQPGSFCPSRRK